MKAQKSSGEVVACQRSFGEATLEERDPGVKQLNYAQTVRGVVYGVFVHILLLTSWTNEMGYGKLLKCDWNYRGLYLTGSSKCSLSYNRTEAPVDRRLPGGMTY